MEKRLIVGDSIAHSIARMLIAISVKVIEMFNKKAANNAKRLLFISSVYTELVREGVLNQITHEQLNDKFCLANNTDCLTSGCVISKGVWRDIDFKTVLDNSVKNHSLKSNNFKGINDIDSFTRYLIATTPTWIQYDRNDMVNDIKELFNDQNQKVAAFS